MSNGDMGKCKVGGKVSAMWCSIFCRFATGSMCGESIPEVAASM